jgi:hypothetical protein
MLSSGASLGTSAIGFDVDGRRRAGEWSPRAVGGDEGEGRASDHTNGERRGDGGGGGVTCMGRNGLTKKTGESYSKECGLPIFFLFLLFPVSWAYPIEYLHIIFFLH